MTNAPQSTKIMFNCYKKDHHENMALMIDVKIPVKVYFNLHKRCWSVMQKNKVRFHTDYIVLENCTFEVSSKGREKVLREKRKNVHAFVVGHIVHPSRLHDIYYAEGLYEAFDDNEKFMEVVTYNPYVSSSFYQKYAPGIRVSSAKYVDMMSSTIDKILASRPSF